MPSPPEATAQFYRALQRIQVILIAAGRRSWARMDEDFDRSWISIAADLTLVVSAGQLAAAQAAATYVPAVLAETDQPDLPEAVLRPRGFAGRAADGRSLPGLLYGAVSHTRAAVRGRSVLRDGYLTRVVPGATVPQALAVGGRHLDSLLRTVVADAGRAATSVEISVRPDMGWVRMVNPPCCGRCAILAGRWYRFNAGFDRHRNCDCTQIPAQENVAGDLRTDPAALFDSGQITGLTRLERERLAAGEDPTQVINASRDMWRARRRDQRLVDRGARPRTSDPEADDRADMQAVEHLFDRLSAGLTSRQGYLAEARAAGFIQ